MRRIFASARRKLGFYPQGLGRVHCRRLGHGAGRQHVLQAGQGRGQDHLQAALHLPPRHGLHSVGQSHYCRLSHLLL